MSEFKVEILKIKDVKEHPNADRLNIVEIEGYSCISNKLQDGSARYEKDDYIVYIPEVAVLPEWLLKKMNFWDSKKNKGALSGKKGNRVKAIKLRGIVSQGILYPVKKLQNDKFLIEGLIDVDGKEYHTEAKQGDNLAEVFGIVKYEPPIPTNMQGIVGNLIDYTRKYDIENLQRYPDIFTNKDIVVVHEKLHGTNTQIGIICGIDDSSFKKYVRTNVLYPFKNPFGINAGLYVTSKGMGSKGLVQKFTEDNQYNLYLQMAKKYFIDSGTGMKIFKDYVKYSKNFQITFFAEIIGKDVQDLHYGLQNEKEMKIFDIYTEDKDILFDSYMNHSQLTNFCDKYDLPKTPLLYQGFFDIEKMNELRQGNTVISGQDHIREGIVIRCKHEKPCEDLYQNRKQLKYINPDYLTRKSATEYN